MAISCAGPVVVEGRKVAAANGLALGKQAGACFGRMVIYDGPDHQLVVTGAMPACPRGRAVDVYGKSRAGSWYSYFEKPLCTSATPRVSVGPKDPWGDWMLTIDGQHYDSRGAFYVPVTY